MAKTIVTVYRQGIEPSIKIYVFPYLNSLEKIKKAKELSNNELDEFGFVDISDDSFGPFNWDQNGYMADEHVKTGILDGG